MREIKYSGTRKVYTDYYLLGVIEIEGTIL